MLHTTKSATQKSPSTAVSKAAWAFALLAALASPTAIFSQETTVPVPVATPHVTSRAKVEPGRAASYDNKYEVYGGLIYMNGQAGQNLPNLYSMGGGELMGTYWVGDHLGVSADYRLGMGTTALFPNKFYNRVLVSQNILSGGVQWRGVKNRYAAVDYHALFGATRGNFDHAIQNYPGGSPISATNLGLYPNKTSPYAALGGSIDFNYSANLAVRVQPDLVLNRFGTGTGVYVAVSAGVMYRFGHR